MAKILDSQYSNLIDGQKLESSQLDQDRGVIRVAVNDNQDQLYRIWFGEDHNYAFDTKADLDNFASPVDLDYAVVLTDEDESSKVTLYQYQTSAWVLIAADYSLNGLVTGTTTVGNASLLSGASLSLFSVETLQDDDNKIPTSKQVMEYIETEVTDAVMLKSDYDTEGTAILDVKFARSIGTNGASLDYARLLVMSDYLNQSLKTTDSPTFAGLDLNGDLDLTGYDALMTTLTLYNALGNATISFNGEDVVAEYDGITREWGKNLFVGVKARTIIGDGVCVQYDGAVGTSGKIWIKIADEAEINVAPYLFLGVTTTTFTANQERDVNWFGAINEIDTTGYDGNSGTSADEGEILYFDSINGNGGFTLDEPEAPNVQIKVGIISIYHATAGQIKVRPHVGHFLGDAHDVYFNGHTYEGGEFPLYEYSNSRFEIGNINNYSFIKTGWPVDIQANVDHAFSGLTYTLTINTETDYYINNVKYTIPADDYTVDITDTSGAWYFYFTGDKTTLTASQVAWTLRPGDKCLCAEGTYNATTNEMINLAYEFHDYEYGVLNHYHDHFALGTVRVNGLSLSQTAAAETCDITQGKIMDEGILVQILDGVVGSAKFTQPLAPLEAYKYWRIGASEIYKDSLDSDVVYSVGGIPQLNHFDGSVYSLVDMTNNKFGAYWLIIATDTETPVQYWLGQAEATTLNDAIEANGTESMNFGSITVAEQAQAFRIMVQRDGAGYTIEQIDEITKVGVGSRQEQATSHGSLSGLTDDDHTQYLNAARLALTTVIAGYDNTTSGLTAVELGIAIDEVLTLVDINTSDILDRVEHDLSGYSVLTELTAVGTEKLYLNGAADSYITLDDIASFAALSADAFNSSTDYAGNGLGSYKSAMLTVHQGILSGTNGEVYVDIKTQENDMIVYVEFPTITSNENDLELSTDNDTTYYDVLVNGGTVFAELFSEKIVKFRFDGTNFITELESISQQFTYDSIVNSVYGNGKPIKGISEFNELRGLLLNQPVLNGDTVETIISDDSATQIQINDDGSLVFGNSYLSSYRTINVVTGDEYFVLWKLKTDSVGKINNIGIQYPDDSRTLTTGFTNSDFVYGILTADQTGLVNFFAYEGTAGLVERDYQMVIPITNTPLHSHTASQINNIVLEYFEGIDYITDFELKSEGVNTFDGELESGTLSSSDGSEAVAATDIRTADFSVVEPSTAYIFNYSGGGTGRVFYYDSNYTFISLSTTDVSFTTPATARFVKARWTGDTDLQQEIQLNLGTVKVDTPYNSPETNFKLTGDFLSVGTDVWDIAYYENGKWWKDGYVKSYTLTEADIISFTEGTNVDYASIYVSSLSGIVPQTSSLDGNIFIEDYPNEATGTVDLAVNEWKFNTTDTWLYLISEIDTYADLAAAKTGLAGTVVYYALANKVTTEIQKDGSLIQEPNTTLVQLNNPFATEYLITFSLNSKAQVGVLTDKVTYLQEEIDDLEADIVTLQADIDTRTKYTLLTSSTSLVDDDLVNFTTITTTDLSLYDAIEVYCSFGAADLPDFVYKFTYEGSEAQYPEWLYSMDTTTKTHMSFKLYCATTTSVRVNYGTKVITTFSTGAGVRTAENVLYVNAIYGVKY
jgi:hypothetical protein